MFEESACQNSNRLLTTSFKMALRKNKIKFSHTKINHIFPCNKNGSTESHNYPINLIFSVNKNLVYFWREIFFLDVIHNISRNMTFWKEDAQKCKSVILFWTGLYIYIYTSTNLPRQTKRPYNSNMLFEWFNRIKMLQNYTH